MLTFIDKCFKKINRTLVLDTRMGIKGFNYRFWAAKMQVIDADAVLDPALLHIGFDALRDEYTLTGTPLQRSPHYEFMCRLRDGLPLEGCEYVERLRAGTLDERFPMKVDAAMIAQFRATYAQRVQAMRAGELEPAICYPVGGHYYLRDGKHRAALALMLGEKLPCRVVAPGFLLQGTRRLQYEKMLQRPDRYGVNIRFIQSIQEGQ